MPRSVLVVDDDPDYRYALCTMLAHLSLEPYEAGDAWTALHVLEEEPTPDLICLDLMLPAISGFELCEKIRKLPWCNRVPILVISARVHPQDIALAMKMGATAFLPKPLRMRQLADQIAALLAPSLSEASPG